MEKITKTQALEIYAQKGLNGLRAALKKSGATLKENVIVFGLDGLKTRKEKSEFLNLPTIDLGNTYTITLHYYSQLVTKKSTKWKYNTLRAIEIIVTY